MTQRKLCIFDLDGTLVDTLQDITNAVNQALSQLGLSPLPADEIEGYVGLGARWLLTRSLQAAGDPEAALLPEARERFFPIYRAHLTDHSRPYPGVVETLTRLQQEGHILTVCTNKPMVLTTPLLQELQLAAYFQGVLGGDSLPQKKPDPMPLLHLMEQFAMPPQRTVMIGDTIYDIQAGRKAQAWTCGVSHDGARAQELIDAGAHIVTQDFTAIPTLIHNPEESYTDTLPLETQS